MTIITTHRKQLTLTFKNSQGQISTSSVTHFLDNLDPLILSEQLSRIPVMDTENKQLKSYRLCRSHCFKAERRDTTKTKLLTVNE